jgi:hypothetical protein
MATVGTATSVDRQPSVISQLRINLNPIIPVFRRILSDIDFLRPLKAAFDCFDSGPFINVSLVSLKSAPYAFFGNTRLVQGFDNGLSCRLRYLEAVVTSAAAVVYNLVFSTIFTALSLVTLGQVKILADQMHKNWMHVALAVAALGISCVGTVSPNVGIKANLAAGLAIAVVVLQWVQGDIISKIGTAYQRYRQELQSATNEICQANGINPADLTPFYTYLDVHLNERVKTFSEFAAVVLGVRQHFPRIFLLPR